MRCPVCRYKLKKNTVRCPYCASICAKRTKAELHPYYMREFERLARGEAPRFNAAAFFGGMFHTLYYRCYARFFRLFAPYFLVLLLLAAAYFMRLPYFLWYQLFGTGKAMGDVQFLLAVGLCAIWGLGLSVYNAVTFNRALYQKTGGNARLKTRCLGIVIVVVLFGALCLGGVIYTQQMLMIGVWDYLMNGQYSGKQQFDQDFFVSPASRRLVWEGVSYEIAQT